MLVQWVKTTENINDSDGGAESFQSWWWKKFLFIYESVLNKVRWRYKVRCTIDLQVEILQWNLIVQNSYKKK